jgi:hypothetical protein
MALTSISEYCALNLGGLIRLQYIPITSVNVAEYSRIVGEDRNWETEIPLIDGAEWLSMPLLHKGRSFGETPQRSDQGVAYELSIEGIIPSLRPEATDVLEAMENYRFLILLTDRNRRPWLIGTLDFPLSFSAAAIGGSDTGLNNYRISFSARLPRRMYGYVHTE